MSLDTYGEQGSRAHLAHLTAKQFFPETTTADEIGDSVHVSTYEEIAHPEVAKKWADKAWGHVRNNLDWNDRQLGDHTKGELRAGTEDYQQYQPETRYPRIGAN